MWSIYEICSYIYSSFFTFIPIFDSCLQKWNQMLKSFIWAWKPNIPFSFVRMGHLRCITLLTWLRGFQDLLLFLVVFSLYPSLFGESRDENTNPTNLEKFVILSTKPWRQPWCNIHYWTWPIINLVSHCASLMKTLKSSVTWPNSIGLKSNEN